ncbi:unnamed protein product [Owenia fusiformis]|uniref:Uncharacterized protein n=1 Tax=Owenia fusiformis TaxID=6347 RepID=A0A8J1UUU1_OWEFU|nr:unnamed protein product [Owenia fusiformis]
MASTTLSFEGCNFLRMRLILATVSGKSVKIKKIRSKDDNPGLREFEASFIRLLDKITNGSKIDVSHTGTTLFYQPGMLQGGTIEHECNPQRSIGYYLEALMCLAPFMKTPLKAILRGVTNDQIDPSIDQLKYSVLPVLKRFLGTDDGVEWKVTRRGAAPDGGGEMIFRCPTKQKLRPLQLTVPGKIKRIRGVAWAVRVSPATSNRLVDSARGVLNKCLPDIYIYTDHYKGSQSGKSPGFGMTLVAETTDGVYYTAEGASNPKHTGDQPSEPTVPEELGRDTAIALLDEIYRGGCVDSASQSIACLFMALGQQDVSKIQVGPLSQYTIHFLRHLKTFLQVVFKIDNDTNANRDLDNEDEDVLRTGGDKVLLTCVGVGYTNLGKVIL